MIQDNAVVETSVTDWKRVARVRVRFKFNKRFFGTDSAASSRVGQMLLFRVEGSIPYSASLTFLLCVGDKNVLSMVSINVD